MFATGNGIPREGKAANSTTPPRIVTQGGPPYGLLLISERARIMAVPAIPHVRPNRPNCRIFLFSAVFSVLYVSFPSFGHVDARRAK